jgi:hypothetical protein
MEQHIRQNAIFQYVSNASIYPSHIIHDQYPWLFNEDKCYIDILATEWSQTFRERLALQGYHASSAFFFSGSSSNSAHFSSLSLLIFSSRIRKTDKNPIAETQNITIQMTWIL